MRNRSLWQHCISTGLGACVLALLLLPAGAMSQTGDAAALPDATDFGVRVEAGDLAQARAWLDAGLDPEFAADRIGTGLMIAAWQGNIAMMELFVARGADVNTTNGLSEHALMHAAWRGQLDAVRWLLARGARINSEPLRWSALHYAVFAGHAEVAAALLERGADINARSTNGSSVLMMAVYEGREELARQLLARGADPGIRNDRGDGALEWAFKFGYHDIARLVATHAEFAAAANRPKAQWGAALRSQPVASAAGAAGETAAQIESLQRMREILAERGMIEAVRKLDRRIAALRARGAEPASAGAVDLQSLGSLIDAMMAARERMAARSLSKAVDSLDRKIAALSAKRARAEGDVPPAAVLEISASRSSPADQTTRLLFDSRARIGP